MLASVARSAGLRFPPGVGAVLAGAASMAATDVPLAALGVSDPRTWGTAGWATDAASHLAYGARVQAVLQATPTDRERADPRGAASGGLAARSALLGVATGSRSSLGLAAPALTAPSEAGPAGEESGPAAGCWPRPHSPANWSPTSNPARRTGRRRRGSRRGSAARWPAPAGWPSASGPTRRWPAVAAAAGAAAGAFGGLAWRRWAADRFPDWQAALLEDGVALALAAAACLPGRNRRPLAVVPG